MMTVAFQEIRSWFSSMVNYSYNTTSYNLPDLLSNWPYDRRLHEDYGSVDVEAAEWTTSHCLFQGKSQCAFDSSLFGLLGCLVFPSTSRDLTHVACDLAYIYFVIDEYTDVADPQSASHVYSTVMDVLRLPNKVRSSGDKLGRYMQEFWSRALAIEAGSLDSACIKNFIEGFDVYMKAMVVEAEDRKTKRVRPVMDYMDFRRQTFGAEATIALVGFGLNLPAEILNHPTVRSLTLAAMDLLCLINDMHSYYVEVKRGIAFHNIVTSIMEEYQMNLPAAMDWLQEFGKKRVDQFLSDKNDLPSWGPEIDSKVAEYIERLGYVVRGTDAWSYESERYWAKKGFEIQKTRLVTIQNNRKHKLQVGLLSKEELRTAIQV